MTITKSRVTCMKCKHVFDAELVTDAPIAVAVALMEAVRCPECGHNKIAFGGALPGADNKDGSVVERAARWWNCGERGVSSETIYAAFTGWYVRRSDIPYDPDDYRRCRLLLELIPEWRVEIGKVGAAYPWFKPFSDAWGEMDRLYDEEAPTGRCPKLYALMKNLERKSDLIRKEPGNGR